MQGDQTLSVIADTGDYEDGALIECVGAGSTVAAYQAQYVQYGQVVYQHSDPIELGKAILALDPESTHSAASYVRMSNELLAKMNAGSLESDSLDEMVSAQQAAIDEQRDISSDEPAVEESVSATPISTDISSTTPSVLDDAAATSTPAMPEVLEAATSTVETILPTEASTTPNPMPDVLVPEASSTPQVLKKGGKKLAGLVRRRG